jgi:hypothetical protein
MRRHTKGITKLSWMAFFIFFSIPKNILKYALHREMDHLKAFWNGFVWNIRHNATGERFKLSASQAK